MGATDNVRIDLDLVVVAEDLNKLRAHIAIALGDEDPVLVGLRGGRVVVVSLGLVWLTRSFLHANQVSIRSYKLSKPAWAPLYNAILINNRRAA